MPVPSIVTLDLVLLEKWPGRVAQSAGHLTRKSGVLGSMPGLATYFRFSFRFFQEGQLSVTGESTRGYQKVLSLTWKEPEIWIYSALFFNVVPFQLHTLVPSSFPVINIRSVEVNILVP